MSTTPPNHDAAQNGTPDIANAEKVIERFGGIRPMATKMGIPVTTVQGWKKRNLIPGNRYNDVTAAAQKNGVDLSGLLSAANQPSGNAFARDMNTARQEQAQNPAALKPHHDALAAARATEAAEEAQRNIERNTVTREVMMKEMEKVRTQAVRRSVMAAFAVLSLFLVAAGLLIAAGKQKMEENTRRLAALEQSVAEPDSAPATNGALGEISKKFNDLRGRTEQLQASVADLKQQAQSFMAMDGAALADRMAMLEQKLQELTGGSTDLSLVLQRVQDMQSSLQGQEKMQAAMNDLQGLVGGLQGRMDHMDSALAEEQQSDSALGQALEGVSPQELKAAAMLIGLSQFRDSMNRSGPFADDLALLQTMLGEKDPALNAEIERLAPYAEKGVLSPKGLSNELKGLAGDIVVSSLTGEDVSVQDKALARFHDVLKIQKDGQPITGNDAQASVARAQVMLDSGDVDGAIAELETLRGPARETAQPLIEQAQITAMAQRVQGALTNGILSQIRSAASGMGGGSAPLAVKPGLDTGALIGPLLPPGLLPSSPLMGSPAITPTPEVKPESAPAPAPESAPTPDYYEEGHDL